MKKTVKRAIQLSISLSLLLISSVAFAQGEAQSVDVAKAGASGWIALAAGLAIGLAAFGGALGQARAAASALDGIARNPGAADKMGTPLILGLALIESLVIYALVIAILLWIKL